MKSKTPQFFALSLLCATAISGSLFASTGTCDDYKNTSLSGLSNADIILEAQKILEACKQPKVSQRGILHNVYDALRGKSFNTTEKQSWTTWYQGLDKQTWNETNALGLLDQFLKTNLNISESDLNAPAPSTGTLTPPSSAPLLPNPVAAASPISAATPSGQPPALDWNSVTPYNSGLSDAPPSDINPSLLSDLPSGFTVNKFLALNELAKKDFIRLKTTLSSMGVTLTDKAGWEHVLNFRRDHQPGLRRLPTAPTPTQSTAPTPFPRPTIPAGITNPTGPTGASSSFSDDGSFSSSSSDEEGNSPSPTSQSTIPSAGPAGQPYVASPGLPTSTSGTQTSTPIAPTQPNAAGLSMLDKTIFDRDWDNYTKKLKKGRWDPNQTPPYPYPSYKAPGVLSGPSKQEERTQNEAAWKRAYQEWNDGGRQGPAPTPDSILTASRSASSPAEHQSIRNRFKETMLRENSGEFAAINLAARGWNDDEVPAYIAPFNRSLSMAEKQSNKTAWEAAYARWRDDYENERTNEDPPTPLSILNNSPRSSSPSTTARPRFVLPAGSGLSVPQEAMLRQQFNQAWDAWQASGRTETEPTPDSVGRSLGLITGPSTSTSTSTSTTATSSSSSSGGAASTRPRFKMPAGLSLSNQEQIALAGAYNNAWNEWDTNGRNGPAPTPDSVARTQGHSWTTTTTASTSTTNTSTSTTSSRSLAPNPPRGTPAKVQSVGGGTYMVTLPGETRARPATMLNNQELLDEIANGAANGTPQVSIDALRSVAPAEVIAALPRTSTASNTSTSSGTMTPPPPPGPPPSFGGTTPPTPPGPPPSFGGTTPPTPPGPPPSFGSTAPTGSSAQSTTTSTPSPSAHTNTGGTDIAALREELARLQTLPSSRIVNSQMQNLENKIRTLTTNETGATPIHSTASAQGQASVSTSMPSPVPAPSPSTSTSTRGTDMAALREELARLQKLPSSRVVNSQIATLKKQLGEQ